MSDGEYRYIRNLRPEEIYIEKHLMGSSGNGQLNNPYWGTWVWGATYNQQTYNLVKRYTRRPAEQFYHTSSDPYELTNLIADPAHVDRIARFRKELASWMTSQGDPGKEQDTQQALDAARKGKHLYFPK